MSTAVVTDSTAYLPTGYEHEVWTVPLYVSVDGGNPYDERVFGAARLRDALARKHRVTTAAATVAEFAATYRRVLRSGADGVVSVHLSAELSGTVASARAAAAEVDPARIHVVDSRSTAMGLGFAVLAAADAARHGPPPSEVERAAIAAARRTGTYFSVRTLDYLRRGGRLGTTAAMLGTALAIKPLLHVSGGRVEPLEKVRTASRAAARLVELAAERSGSGRVAVAVHHCAALADAEELADRLRQRLPAHERCAVSEVGPVIGAHIGPGALGVVVLPEGTRTAR